MPNLYGSVVANILIDQLAAALPVVLKNFPTALTHGCRCAPSCSITANNGKRYGLLRPQRQQREKSYIERQKERQK